MKDRTTPVAEAPGRPQTPGRDYAIAAAALAAAIGIRWLLQPWLSGMQPFSTLFAAVAVTVWLAGARPALAVAVVGQVLCDILFVPEQFSASGPAAWLGNVLALTASALIVVAGHAVRVALRRAEASERQREREALQRQGAEQALGESEARYRVLADSLPFSVWQVSADGHTQYSNYYLRQFTGMTAAQHQAADWAAVIHPDEAAELERRWQEALAQRRSFELDHRMRRASDGQYRWFHTMAVPIFGDGRLLKWIGASIDVHDSRTARDALAERERHLELLADNAPGLISYVDAECRYRLLNRQYETWFGHRREDILGRSLAEVLGAEAMVVLQPRVDAVLRGEPVHFETLAPYPGGARWIEAQYVPDRDASGRVRGFFAFVQDISQRKRAEAALRESEQRFRLMADTAPAMLWISDAGGRGTFVSRGWLEYTGQRDSEAAGFGRLDAIHPDDRAGAQREFEEHLARRAPYELDYRLRRADGAYRWVMDAGCPRFGDDGEFLGYIGSVIDVHERRQAEETLRRSEHELADFFDTAAIGLHWVAPDGVILRVNQAELDMLGYTRDEYVGRNIGEFHVDPGVAQDIIEALGRGSTVVDYPAQMRCKDGGVRDVLIRSSARFDGGRFIHTRCFTTDVTARRRAEHALREADRRKDEFLATLAHELRNPLAPVLNAVQLLKLKGPADPELAWGRDVIERQVLTMARLLDDLLDVNRISRGKIDLRRERVTLNSILDGVVETSRPLVTAAGHRIDLDLPAEPIWVDGDPVRLAQVFGNLINNAAKYTLEGGAVRVDAVAADGEVVVTVSDTGIGIERDMLSRVFDIFAQSEPARARSRGGLGVGLYLVQHLVELHRGRVTARSEGPGRGSAFEVRLPLAAAPVAVAEAEPAPGPSPAPRRRLLVVDDLDDAAESLARVLSGWGHEVHIARDGRQAIDTARRCRPDVVVLDLGMPKMNGYETCRYIRQQPWGQAMRFVALTGWGQEDDRRRTAAAGFDAHLVKPVDPAVLAQTLGRL